MDQALIKKLKLNVDEKTLILNAPEEYLLSAKESLGENLHTEVQGEYSFVQAFLFSKDDVNKIAPTAVSVSNDSTMLWLCYPKKSSKIKTDITRDQGWETLEKLGYVGVSLISIDDTWSAMRFRGAELTKPARRTSSATKTVKKVTTNKVVEVPEDLQKVLKENSECELFFTNLAYTHRKEYVNWITSAKREETRNKRIVGTIERLRKGIKNPTIKL
ncbi:YdeI/OmpD-associated family protein [Bacillus sp. RG28]|uniref:YdeI/OmpD-associated family protein n=1 Tax=Gottfriedia endophytica TaxID=2820819 RepID=A0A940NT89_9BACI|nr:YdeI/OmpD-associated family protein [Gottfriedia endophytica]MBP0727118.1 YdeI/OmpD-associated family protein [Gottfriedia endophytica]